MTSRTAAVGGELGITMLNPSPTPSTARQPERAASPQLPPVAGGEAWVVPFEPGGPAWITASAPRIGVIDRRPARSAGTLR